METITFGDVCAFNYKQLENGKYIGSSFNGLFTSLKSFNKNEYPSRFKYLEVVNSSDEEINEYYNQNQ